VQVWRRLVENFVANKQVWERLSRWHLSASFRTRRIRLNNAYMRRSAPKVRVGRNCAKIIFIMKQKGEQPRKKENKRHRAYIPWSVSNPVMTFLPAGVRCSNTWILHVRPAYVKAMLSWLVCWFDKRACE